MRRRRDPVDPWPDRRAEYLRRKDVLQGRADFALDTDEQYLSNECACDNFKRRRSMFCPTCWRSLPPELQKELIQTNRGTRGPRYRKAYAAACELLGYPIPAPMVQLSDDEQP